MHDLIGPGRAPATMSSKEIAELTGKEHKNVLADIRRMLEELGVAAAKFSATAPVAGPNGSTRYFEVFNLPKRESLILVSGYSVQMRARIIDRWQELEAQAAQPAVPRTLPEALRLAADLAEQKDRAEAALAMAAPKAAALDRIATGTTGAVGLRVAAKVAQVPERQFIALLQQHNWIFRTTPLSNWQGYADKEAAGLLEMKCVPIPHGDGTESNVYQVRITPKGMARIAELIERKAPWLRKAAAANPTATAPGVH